MQSCVSFKHAPARRSRRFTLIAVALLAAASGEVRAQGSQAGSPGSKATPDPAFLLLPEREIEVAQTVKVGDSLIVRVLEAQVPGAAKVQVSLAPGSNASEDLDELGWLIEDAEEGQLPPLEQRRASDAYFRAVPLKAGSLTLPSLAIGESAGPPSARTRAVQIQVQSSIAKDDPKPNEPKGEIAPLGMPFPTWIAVLIGILSVLAIAILGWLLGNALKKYWAKRNRIPPEPPKTEDERALLALVELEKQPFLKRGEFKPFYFGVSEVLKAYLGERYHFDAPERTSEELLGFLEDTKIVQDAWVDQIESLFERLDRVKFTDFVPEDDEPKRILEQARAWILQSRRPPAVVATLQPGGRRS